MWKWKLVAQLCLTLGDLMDCSVPGSFVHGILWTRILQCVAMPASRGYSWTKDWTRVSCVAGRFFTTETPRKFTVKHFSFCGLLVHHQENEQFDLNDLWDLVLILMFLVFRLVNFSNCLENYFNQHSIYFFSAYNCQKWCWRRLLRVPWTARRSNQSILQEISPGISLEGMMLKLKLQYFGHLMQRVDSLEKTLMLGGIGGRRRRGRQRMRWLDGITDSMDMSLSELWSWWWTGRPGVLQSMGSQRVRHDRVTEPNWTERICFNATLSIHPNSPSPPVLYVWFLPCK